MNFTAALAVIIDEQQRILITQRPSHVFYGGYWELPGGKLEVGESPAAALTRELDEELGLTVQQCTLMGEVNHQYPEKMIKLIIFLVDKYSGVPSCLDGQLAMKWVHFTELDPESFPEANLEILEIIKNHCIAA